MPYFAKYKLKNNRFELMDSKFYNDYKYEIKDQKSEKLVTKNGKMENVITMGKRLVVENEDLLIHSPAFSKDYIVQMRRTPEEHIEYINSGNGLLGKAQTDFPKNLYLYDYNLNLKKIVKLDSKIRRFTANPNSNTIYIVSIDEGIYNIRAINV